MVRGHDYPPHWAVLPGAFVTAEFVTRDWSERPLIEILGNRQGLLSLGSLLVWAAESAADMESFSITGLSFVHARSSLSLLVVHSLDDKETEGRLVRVDKDQQFEWLVHEELLQADAVDIMGVGFCPDGYLCGFMHGRIADDSEVDLYVARTDIR